MASDVDHLLDEISAILRGQKEALLDGVDWRKRSRAGGFDALEFAAPVSIDGVVRSGLQIRISARSDLPEECVHAQLQVFVPALNAYAHLQRVDWRPLSPHTNNAQAPSALRFKPFRDRYYEFGINRRLGVAGLRQTTTMIAQELPPVGNFNELLAFLRELWKMEGLDRVPTPPWEDRLV